MAYTPAVLDHFHSPRNVGELERPDAIGTMGSPGHGNFMVIHLRARDGRILDARFQTYGCPGAIACGSMVTELARGKSFDEARAISGGEVVGKLGGLPAGKGHCGDLAVGALLDAISKIAPLPEDRST